MTSENLDRVIKALEGKGKTITKHPSGHLTSCPDRDDDHPSLLFGEDESGGVWFKDKARISTTESILSALGLGREVLKGSNGHNGNGKGNDHKPSQKAPTLDWTKPDAIYDYPNERGEPHYRVLRKNFSRADGTHDKTFKQQYWDGQAWQWGRGKTSPVPYRLKELLAADSARWVCLCEGEKDADNLAKFGQVATTHAGGAANTKDLTALIPHVTGRPVAIFQHNDIPGENWAAEAAKVLYPVASEVKVITPERGGWKDYEHQDPSDYINWMKAEGFDIPHAIETMLHKAPVWTPLATEESPSEIAYTFQPLGLTDLLERPDKEWLIKDFIGKGDIAMIYGAPGSGKTFVVIDALFSAVLCQPVAGKFEIAQPLKVAYTAGEGIGGLRSRFAAAANHYQAYQNPNIQNLSIFLDAPQLFSDKLDTSILQFVKDWQDRQAGELDILVIDTLHSAIWGADENAAKDIGVVLQAVKYARDQLGCTVLLIHHSNKTGAYRGSSALHGSMDSMIETKYDADLGEGVMECFKQKDAEHFRKIPFKLVGESVSGSAFVEWGDYITFDQEQKRPAAERAKAAILDLLKQSEGLNQTQIVKSLDKEALDIGRNAILSALTELELEGAVMVATGARGAKIYQLSLSIS